ncbi:MAG: hypothetical protein EGQ63_00450 [Clostridiales bacterium]|nr:hypothetical protein [Clostridiales bacterium]
MLTPVDLQNKVFKGGIGFDKKDVESFMHELSSDYEQLYRSNVELTDKVATLNESLQHYKSVEDSMQKALTLSEKTAEETINAANDKARLLTTEAEKKAENILADAKQELEDTKNEIFRLQQQQKKFKEQFTHVLESQLKMMDGEMIDIDLGDDFQPAASYDSGFGNFSGGGLGSEGGLGGGLGGGYVGSGSSSFERTNQEPAFDRGSLNMDPFADAANGGGRFSRQTGGSYNGSKKKAATTRSDSGKSSLNMKKENPEARRVKRTPVQQAETPLKEATIHTANSTPVTQESQVMPEFVNSQASTNSAKEPETSASRTTQASFTKQNTSVSHPTDEPTVSGEVEEKVNESTMLDSEDNYNTGFDFVEEADTSNVFVSDQPVSGEVEDKVDESTMLDSEDNYTTGFDFVEDEDTTISSGFAQEEDTYSGEVEDKVNESNMLDSEDNYNDGFDFVVGNEQEEEIPTILGNGGAFTETAGTFQNTGLNGSSFTTSESLGEGLNIDPFKESAATTTDEDVLTGDVEDKLNESTLLGNDDDTDEGFNFL